MNFLKLFDSPSLIAAHRGANAIAPENTLKALEMSVGRCDFMKVDVCLSKDLTPVVMHDDTLERTTNVESLNEFKGREPYFVHDFSDEELKRLDYGEGESLLTLNAALEFVKENELFLNVAKSPHLLL
jgi:glycerophosphoryl diester phosphodiesterase